MSIKIVFSKKSSLIKRVLTLQMTGLLCLTTLGIAQSQPTNLKQTNLIETSYIDSKDELEDYILDTGDGLSINFSNVPEFSGRFTIDEQGEIFLKRLKLTYVRGLTIKELTKILETRYKEFLINPEIFIRISKYKPIRVSIKGEVRKAGIIKFESIAALNFKTENQLGSGLINNDFSGNQSSNPNLIQSKTSENINTIQIKRSGDYITTISNAIKRAGGLTSYSNISKIEIIRDVPLGQGGGKKKAVIDLMPFIKGFNANVDIRLFDGDMILIPRLEQADSSIVPLSILSGITPDFIQVSVTGRIENPGKVKIPLEGSLSDAMNLTGPKKTLAGKIFLIRYNKDGTLTRKSINYAQNATPGSTKNPFLIEGDLITVKNSMLGKSTGVMQAITEPFVGIYATKELIQSF